MTTRFTVASWFTWAGGPLIGLAVLLSGCALDRAGLLQGGDGQSASGGHTPTTTASGGHAGNGSGGTSILSGSGGTGSGGQGTVGTGGQPQPLATGGAIGGSGESTGGSSGTGGASGGSDVGTGGTSTGGIAGGVGAGGSRGGAGGSKGGAGGSSVGGRGGWWSGGGGATGGSGNGGSIGGLQMCDPSIRDKDSCNFGTSACRKTCGVSAMATKPCTCSQGQWNCGDCSYGPGDYSCYRLPASSVPACPFGTVNGNTTCTKACALCSGYRDTTGSDKVGYCSCEDAGTDAPPVYRCASTSEWPPQ